MNVTKNLSSFVYSHLQGAMVTVYGIFILMFLSTTMVLLSERMVVGISSSVNILKEKQAELNMISGKDLWDNLDITQETTFNSSNGWDMGEITFFTDSAMVVEGVSSIPTGSMAIDTVYPGEKIPKATIKVSTRGEFIAALEDINSSSVIWVAGWDSYLVRRDHWAGGGRGRAQYGGPHDLITNIPSGAKIYGGFDPEFKSRPRADLNGDGVIEKYEFVYEVATMDAFHFSNSSSTTIVDGITFHNNSPHRSVSLIEITNSSSGSPNEYNVTGGEEVGVMSPYPLSPTENMLQGDPEGNWDRFWGVDVTDRNTRTAGKVTYYFPTPIPYKSLWVALTHEKGSGDIYINEGASRINVRSHSESTRLNHIEPVAENSPGVLESITIDKNVPLNSTARYKDSFINGIKVKFENGDIAWLKDNTSSPQIRNCFFTGNNYAEPLILNIGSSPTITDCMFYDNMLYHLGEGEENPAEYIGIITNRPGNTPQFVGNATIKNCSFINNDRLHGDVARSIIRDGEWDRTWRVNTAIYNYETGPTITDCKFENNNLGIYSYYNEPSLANNITTIVNCRFHGHNRQVEGRVQPHLFGIRVENTLANILGCIFTGEHMRAVYFKDKETSGGKSAVNIVNCTVTAASDAPGQITTTGHVWLTIQNSIFWNPGPASICISAMGAASLSTYSCIVARNLYGEWVDTDISPQANPYTTANIDVDPQFESFDHPTGDTDENDLSLQAESPGKNAGFDAFADVWRQYNVDIGGGSRMYDGGVDLGAYGSTYKLVIIYVDSSRVSELEDGTSWETAFSNLQSALESSRYGDQIWVAQGTYIPVNGCEPVESHSGRRQKNRDGGYRVWIGRDCSFNIPAGVEVYGGFSGTERPDEISSRDYEIFETILSGDIGNRQHEDDWTSNEDNAYHVVTFEQEKLMPAVLDGFTITDGVATGNGPYGGTFNQFQHGGPHGTITEYPAISNARGRGGGIYMSECHPILRNLIITGNRAHESDYAMCKGDFTEITQSYHPNKCGVMYDYYSNQQYQRARQEGSRRGTDGGGVYAEYSNPIFSNVTVTNNYARKRGGGLAFNNCPRVIMTDVEINNNYQTCGSMHWWIDWGGGGLWADSSNIYIDRFMFDDNEAAFRGGGLCGIESSMYLSNGLITGNSSSTCSSCGPFFGRTHGEEGGGLHIYLLKDLIIDHVTFASNTNGRIRNNYGGYAMSFRYHDYASWGEVSMRHSIFYNNLGVEGTGWDEDRGFDGRYPHPESAGPGLHTEGGWNSIGGWLFDDSHIPADGDPLFFEMKNPGVGGGDYHIAESSPARRYDNHTIVNPHLYDYDGNIRYTGVDDSLNYYGGYEWSQPPQTFTIQGRTGVNGEITRTRTSD